ncbi:glycerol-3-phosphate 1-O-acyltransferase PlsY [Coprothermobacteraceae bacterium]|nr:glycerol-3-phosphate 1-O-acyltransferase PlsY [Coprothermobacteraceae bacterium]
MNWLLYIVAAYLIGSIPFGYILAKAEGIDIRTVGSGNVGATNVYRALGIALGLQTLALDFAKGFIPSFLAFHYLSGLTVWQQWAVAIAPILGHCVSVFLRFRGGKGMASAFGVFSAYDWRFGVAMAAVWLFIVISTKLVSLGSLMATWSVPLFAWALRWGFHPGMVLLAILVTWAHRSNIRRLMAGEEYRTPMPWERKS